MEDGRSLHTFAQYSLLYWDGGLFDSLCIKPPPHHPMRSGKGLPNTHISSRIKALATPFRSRVRRNKGGGGGCGSPVVKISDHGRHAMSSSPVPLKTHRVGQRCTLMLSRAETSSHWCGVVVRRGGASSCVVHVT
ncbi:uncharacterized protein TNCV_2163741 [Trichonephila clavipes]|nr:uncharacterized protein TNCV_2163741 [Trichonephila clavipes]